MRNWIIVAAACCILTHALARPSQVEENGDSEAEEVEYKEGNDAPEENSAHENEGALNNEQQEQVADTDQEEEYQRQGQGAVDETARLRASDDEQPTASHYKFLGYKSGRKADTQDNKSDLEYEAQKQRDSSTLDDGGKVNDRADDAQHVTNRDVNDFKIIRNDEDLMNAKTLESRNTPDEKGRPLFETMKNVPENVDKHRYNNEALDSSDQTRYIKQYCPLQPENKGLGNVKAYKFRRFRSNRDRRNVDEEQKETNRVSSAAPDADSLESTGIEDEEAAIKRHVKKLSSEELEELLNSLSDDKRELLKKIMGSDIGDKDNNIAKRDVAKKADSLQERSNSENGLDSSKQENSEPGDSADSSTTASTISSQLPVSSDMNELIITKTTEASKGSLAPNGNSDLTAEVRDQKPVNTDNLLNSGLPTTNNQAANIANDNTDDQKIQNKREASFDSNSNDDPKSSENELGYKNSRDSDNQEYLAAQDEDFSQLMNDENQLHEENKNAFKREAPENAAEFSDSIRSLEESFPKPNTYDESDPYSGSDMAPLIRVKRKNLMMKKRSAAMLPEAKVAYFPYRAENDDEDNDEGSEFDDDGFYDRTSNLARSVEDKSLEEGLSSNAEKVRLPKSIKRRSQPKKPDGSKLSENENIESDMSLGSDTDSVLTGVEGVDDNLMFSSGSRNRRGTENNFQLKKMPKETANAPQEENIRSARSTPFIEDEMKKVTENYINAPNLPVESDAFGPLPRNYDGELGRYKRVRRVKQVQTQAAASDA